VSATMTFNKEGFGDTNLVNPALLVTFMYVMTNHSKSKNKHSVGNALNSALLVLVDRVLVYTTALDACNNASSEEELAEAKVKFAAASEALVDMFDSFTGLGEEIISEMPIEIDDIKKDVIEWKEHLAKTIEEFEGLGDDEIVAKVKEKLGED